jgi:3-(3-hydroxy-phenyl)propionate hydroxylase
MRNGETSGMSTADGAEPVLVAGGGPVGMTAALALDARGVPVEVLEADPEDRRRPGSRAIYVHGSTVRTLMRLDERLGEALVEEGLVWPTRRTLWRGKEVFSRTYDDPGGDGEIPHFTSIPQSRTEQHMLDALQRNDIEIHWDSEVETVDTSEAGVRLETAGGTEYRTPYLVGADGAGSVVRKEIGAEFEGDQSENSFIIADVAEHPEQPRENERLFHYDAPEVGGRNVLVVPFSGGWRVDIQCLPDDDPEELSGDERMREFVSTILGERYADRIEWVSTYKFLQVMADRFVDDHRRVLLAGEAAHLFAPFGARGMNSGIADADEAASAIAVAARADSRAVAEAEMQQRANRRRTAAAFNRDAAGQALEHLQGEGAAVNARKAAAARLADYWEGAGEWLDDAPYGPHGSPPIVTAGNY